VHVQCEIATVFSRFDVRRLSDLVVKSNVSLLRLAFVIIIVFQLSISPLGGVGKLGAALVGTGKGMYGSFFPWLNAWVADETERFIDSFVGEFEALF